MNNPTKPTRIFYTFRTPHGVRTPACLETGGGRDHGVAVVHSTFGGRYAACQLAGIREPFASRGEVAAELAATEADLASCRMAVLARTERGAELKYDLERYADSLRAELAGW